MHRRILGPLLCLLLSVSALATPFTANLQTLTGGAAAQSWLQLDLRGCGTYIVQGGATYVPKSIILKPNALGIISANVVDESTYTCGGAVGTAYYSVTIYWKDGNNRTVTGQQANYDITGSATFNLNNATVKNAYIGGQGPAGPPGPAGPSGVSGATWYQGSLPPSSSTGADNDFYLDSGTGYVYQKQGGVWSNIANIKGPQGVQGATGQSGSNGLNGATWLVGSGTPGNSFGADNDYYLNSINGDVYRKATGAWSQVANIKGPAGDTGPAGVAGPQGLPGANGSRWYSGAGAPSGGTGSNGDLYLNSTNGDVYEKQSGAWGSPVANIVGPQGQQGIQGNSAGATNWLGSWDSGTTYHSSSYDAIEHNGSSYLAIADSTNQEPPNATYWQLLSQGGAAGTNGSVWFNAAGVPSNGTGADGDYDLNTTNGDVYKKTSGAWALITNIRGATGAQGSTGAAGANGATWYQGSSAPSPSLGVNGDFFFNTATSDVLQKIAGGWSAIANIRGAAGQTGQTGPAGSNGTNGTNGATWFSGSVVPGSGTGVDGDYYLNTATSDVYKKVSGSWSVVINIKGATGATGTSGVNGATWYAGAGVPSSLTGVNNDFDLDTNTGDVYRKQSGSWVLIANIRGAQGIQGTAGVGVPAGGAISNCLIKRSATDYDLQWSSSCGGSGGASTWNQLQAPTSQVVEPLGTYGHSVTIGDYGATPSTGAVTITDTATSTTDTSFNWTVDTGATSRHSPLNISIQAVKQLQVCWQPGPQGQIVIGSALACSSLFQSPFTKFVVMSNTGSHNTAVIYNRATNQTGTSLLFHSSTAAGTGFNFWAACTGASTTDASCLSANYVAYLRGDGFMQLSGLNVSGNTSSTGNHTQTGNQSVSGNITAGGTISTTGTAAFVLDAIKATGTTVTVTKDYALFVGSDNALHCQLSAALGGGSCAPTGGGTTVSVNGSSVSNPNFNNTIPAAETNYINAKVQASGSSVSVEVPTGTTSSTVAAGNDSRITGAEQASNKSSATGLGTSDTLYPTQNAVKTYLDNALAGLSASGCTAGTVASADATGTAGACKYDSSYYYLAVATNAWKRTAWDATWLPTVAQTSHTPGTATYNNDQSVTIADTTPGATMKYCTGVADTCDPSTGTSYTVPVSIAATGTYLRSQGYLTGYSPSTVRSTLYTLKVATPTSTVTGGSTGSLPDTVTSCTNCLTFATATTGSTYTCYTTATPPATPADPSGTSSSCTSGTHYTGALSPSATTAYKWRTYKANYDPSDISGGTLTISGGGGSAARVQYKHCATTSGTTSLTCTLDAATTPGNFLVAYVATNSTDGTFSDSNSDTFTRPSACTANAQVKCGYVYNMPAAVTTVTFSWSGTADEGMIIAEYSGVKTSADPLDQSRNRTQGGGANTTYDTLGITTTATTLLIGGLNNVSGNIAPTPTSGMTIVDDYYITRIGYRLTLFEYLNQSTGTYNNAGSFASGSSYGANILGLLLQ